MDGYVNRALAWLSATKIEFIDIYATRETFRISIVIDFE